MDFTTYEMALMVDKVLYRVSIAPDALQFWWGGDAGPQTAEELVTAHMDEIEAVVVQKVAEEAINDEGTIVVTDEDLE